MSIVINFKIKMFMWKEVLNYIIYFNRLYKDIFIFLPLIFHDDYELKLIGYLLS